MVKKIVINITPPASVKILGDRLLFPSHLTVAHLQTAIRARIRSLKPDESIYLFFNNRHLVPQSRVLNDLMLKYGVDEELFVHLYLESTFG